MTKDKLFSLYKKGEWLLGVAILFQLINVLIITVKYLSSGMGIYVLRYLGIIAVAFLLCYAAIELVIIIWDIVKNCKNKDYFKCEGIRQVIRVALLVTAAVLAVVSLCHYFTDRLNFNSDYDTTCLYQTLSLLIAVLAVGVKDTEINAQSLVSNIFMFALIVAFFGLSYSLLGDFVSGYQLNLYQFASILAMVAFILNLKCQRAAAYVFGGLMGLSLVCFLAPSIIGGIYGFPEVDLFYWSRFAVSIAAIVFIVYVAILIAKNIMNFNDQRIFKIISLSVAVISFVLLFMTIVGASNIVVNKPNDMHTLEPYYIIAAVGLGLALVATELRKKSIFENCLAGVSTIFIIVTIIVLCCVLNQTSYVKFYKPTFLASIGLIVIYMVNAAYIVFMRCWAAKKSKKQIDASETNAAE